MTAKNSKATDQAQIRQIMDNCVEAVRSKDVDGIMSHYATDIVVFDLAPPLQYRGADECRKNWEAWFPTFRGSDRLRASRPGNRCEQRPSLLP